jgi:hypothetical protein
MVWWYQKRYLSLLGIDAPEEWRLWVSIVEEKLI